MAPDATGGRYCSMLRPLLVVMVAVSLINVPLQAQNPGVRRLDDTHDKVLRSLGEYFESLRVQAGIPGLAATIVGPDEVIWEQALGRQDNERSTATRTDTPFHLDGLGQVVTAALVLRCVEEGRLSLEDRISEFSPDSPDANATIRQVLSHTSSAQGGLVFAYRPERLEPLARAISVCTEDSFRETLADLLDRLAMVDSVPGPDIVHAGASDRGRPVSRGRRAVRESARPSGRPVPRVH